MIRAVTVIPGKSVGKRNGRTLRCCSRQLVLWLVQANDRLVKLDARTPFPILSASSDHSLVGYVRTTSIAIAKK
jgi:hypothetical protein